MPRKTEKVFVVDRNLHSRSIDIPAGTWGHKFRVRLGKHSAPWAYAGDFDEGCRFAAFKSPGEAEQFIDRQRSLRAANHITSAANNRSRNQ